ncbi:MAG: hypothetical protein AABX89_08705 [Candidatus Thermoplasmatota archaeon]
MRFALAAACLLALGMPGCASPTPQCPDGLVANTGTKDGDVTVFNIAIGWSADLKTQYMRPGCLVVEQGAKVRFIVTNNDDSGKDYNGASPGKDNFHDVALLDYAGKDYEHEAYAGRAPVTTCADGDASSPKSDGSACQQSFFVASETGVFRIICEVRTNPTHDALGMHASFVVQ